MDYVKKKCIVLRNTKDIAFNFKDKMVCIDAAEKIAIQAHWVEQVNDNPKLFNGTVLSVDTMNNDKNKINFDIIKTDYAHYVYTMNKLHIVKNPCKAMAVSGLAVTSDNYIVLCKNGLKTSFPGIIQCIGGGVDRCIYTNGKMNIINNLVDEFREEINLTISESMVDQSSNYLYLRERNSTIGICYIVKLEHSMIGLKALFKEYQDQKNYDHELESLVFIKNNKEQILSFCSRTDNLVDYIEAILCDFSNIKKLNWPID